MAKLPGRGCRASPGGGGGCLGAPLDPPLLNSRPLPLPSSPTERRWLEVRGGRASRPLQSGSASIPTVWRKLQRGRACRRLLANFLRLLTCGNDVTQTFYFSVFEEGSPQGVSTSERAFFSPRRKNHSNPPLVERSGSFALLKTARGRLLVLDGTSLRLVPIGEVFQRLVTDSTLGRVLQHLAKAGQA